MSVRLVLLPCLVLSAAVAGCAAPGTPTSDPLDRVRAATLPYATVEAAEAAGYEPYTRYLDNHGVHYRNPAFPVGFVPERPPALVFVKDDQGALVLGAVEYSLPRTTNLPPEGFPGEADVWAIHEASCHFSDGLSFPEKNEGACPPINPASGSAFLFWHPDQWTLHAWLHRENPDGMFKAKNPGVK